MKSEQIMMKSRSKAKVIYQLQTEIENNTYKCMNETDSTLRQIYFNQLMKTITTLNIFRGDQKCN